MIQVVAQQKSVKKCISFILSLVRLVVVGGEDWGHSFMEPHSHTNEYNFAKQMWTSLGDYFEELNDGVMISVNNNFYRFGGSSSYKYSYKSKGESSIGMLKTDTWTKFGEMTIARSQPAGILYMNDKESLTL